MHYTPQIKRDKKMHPALESYIAKEFAQKAHYDEKCKSYVAPVQGRMVKHCGLIEKLRSRHYVQCGKKQSKRRDRSVNIKGSTSSIGKRVDLELLLASVGKPKKRQHKFTTALLNHWKNMGHTLARCQVPVLVRQFHCCMTQADVITMDSENKLWLWEVKTGAPIGFHHRHGDLHHVSGDPVPCNGMAQWQLQLEYTRRALMNANIPISHAHIIQIHDQRKGPTLIKVHPQSDWLFRIN